MKKLKKYVSRVNVQEFLNLPGHHDGAYVRIYVEDTTGRDVGPYSDENDNSNYIVNPDPRIVFEITDCSNKVNLEFEIDSPNSRQNSFHKVDTLIECLQEFRKGLEAESMLYKQREKRLDAVNDYKDSFTKDKVPEPPYPKKWSELKTILTEKGIL